MAKNPPPPAAMFALIMGRWVSHLIYVAAKLELADRLKQGSRTVEELATAAEVQAPALDRVLRALASVGIFAETKGERSRARKEISVGHYFESLLFTDTRP